MGNCWPSKEERQLLQYQRHSEQNEYAMDKAIEISESAWKESIDDTRIQRERVNDLLVSQANLAAQIPPDKEPTEHQIAEMQAVVQQLLVEQALLQQLQDIETTTLHRFAHLRKAEAAQKFVRTSARVQRHVRKATNAITKGEDITKTTDILQDGDEDVKEFAETVANESIISSFTAAADSQPSEAASDLRQRALAAFEARRDTPPVAVTAVPGAVKRARTQETALGSRGRRGGGAAAKAVSFADTGDEKATLAPQRARQAPTARQVELQEMDV